MTFQKPLEFHNPRTPTYKKGYLVIDSDDGNEGDYKYWFRLMQTLDGEYNQWVGINSVVMCPAVVSSLLNTPGKLSTEQLKEMVSWGCEVLSHGRYHAGLGTLSVSSPATKGATAIEVYGSGQIRVEAGYVYEISEGEVRETIKFISPQLPNNTYGTTLMNLEAPLQNTYTSNAKIRLTEESMQDLLVGCVDDLNSLGFDCFHHVYTFHAGSQHTPNPDAVAYVSQVFRSGRGTHDTRSVNEKDTMQLENLKCVLSAATEVQIDALLDETANKDGLMIFYGHGEPSVVEKLEYLIRGAFERGIRITTRSDALNRMGVQ